MSSPRLDEDDLVLLHHATGDDTLEECSWQEAHELLNKSVELLADPGDGVSGSQDEASSNGGLRELPQPAGTSGTTPSGSSGGEAPPVMEEANLHLPPVEVHERGEAYVTPAGCHLTMPGSIRHFNVYR